MVELRLDAVEGPAMPTDCFISVRVGDTQKMSKLSSSRVFRFPQAEKGKHGKIEVFKRIGYATVDIDPKLGDAHNVSVDCAKSGFGKLGLRIGVENNGVKKSCRKSSENHVAHPSESISLEKERNQTKTRLAHEYLLQHRIEMHLADAMQKVLRERPENPNEFIAHRLVAACAANPKLPSQDKVQVDGLQFQKINHSACDVPAVQEMQPTKRLAVASDDTPLTQDFSENCNGGHPRDQVAQLVERRFEHLPSVGAWRCVRLPAQARATENCDALASDLAVVDCRDRFRFMPSVGTWCMSRFHVTSFQLQQKQQMQMQMQMPVEQLQVKKRKQEQQQQLLQKTLKNHHRRLPSVGTWMLPRETKKALAVQSDEHRVIRRFCHMPSVGTWLAPRFPRPASLKITEDRTVPIFCHTPSVGTWYAARISRVGVAKESCDTEVKTLSVSDTALVRALPLSCKATAKCDAGTHSFRNMPSVVTWMTRRPTSTAVIKRTCSDVRTDVFHRLPSVGTWYVPRRPNISMMETPAHTADIEIASNKNAKLRCFQHMPSVSTWLAPRVSRAKTADSRMEVVSKVEKGSCYDVDICRFRYMPSVCTWLAPRARGPAVVDERILVDVPIRSFCHLPSVGTWLAPRVLKITARSSSFREDIEVCSVNNASCKTGELRRFPLLLSVGTWLAPRGSKPVMLGKCTSQDAKIPDFRRMPSVCTWLAPRRQTAVVVEVKRPKHGQ